MARTDAGIQAKGAPRTDQLRPFVLLAGLAGVLTYYFINAVRRVYGDTGDFGHFYHAARALLAGQDLYTSWHHGYIYPPLLAFLYTPLALLREDAAAVVLLVCNLGLLLTAAYLAARELADRFGVPADATTLAAVVLTGVLLTGDKLRAELQMWQTNSLLLLLFVLALRWLDRRPLRAGLALGLAFNIKYLPVVVLPYLVFRRRWRAAAAFVAAVPVFALLPALLTGWDGNLRHLGTAYSGILRLLGGSVEPSQAANIADLRDLMSVSLTSAVARLAGPGVPAAVAFGLVGALALAALFAANWLYRRRGVAFWYRPDGAAPDQPLARALTGLEWAGLITAALVFSPQTNTRHFSLLLFANLAAALLLLRPRGEAPRWPLALGTVVLLLGMVLPPGAAGFLPVRVVWVTVSGIAWCALLMFGTLLWAGLSAAQAVAEESPDTGTLPAATEGPHRVTVDFGPIACAPASNTFRVLVCSASSPSH
jgi:hypothetical protein